MRSLAGSLADGVLTLPCSFAFRRVLGCSSSGKCVLDDPASLLSNSTLVLHSGMLIRQYTLHNKGSVEHWTTEEEEAKFYW